MLHGFVDYQFINLGAVMTLWQMNVDLMFN